MFHFLRPEWLLLLLPWLLVLWLGLKQRRSHSGWSTVVDKRLLPHLLEKKLSSGRRYSLGFWSLIALLLIVAMAGPTWSKRSLPAFQQQSALVVLFDLSMSMNTEDIKPSRLAQARLKLIDLLQRRNEGQTALVVYAASAFTVTPLTDDAKTIQSLVSTLSPDMMPAQGSRADLAIEKATELLANAGIAQGDILLMTDGIESGIAKSIDIGNNRLSVLAVGSEQGAPIPGGKGGFVKDQSGSIVISRTDFDSLQSLAMQQGGMFSRLTLDNQDLDALDLLLQSRQFQAEHQQSEYETENWIEQGPWLLLLVTPLAALAFRRGFILPVLIASIIVSVPEGVYAQQATDSAEFSLWDRLWNNSDQLGQQALQQGDSAQAAELFNQSDWKAAAHYKNGDYDKALELWKDAKTPNQIYNRANTEAQLGMLEQAIESYDQVLAQDPDHQDAAANRETARRILQQKQQQQQQQSGDSDQQDSEQKSDQDQDQQGDSQSQQDGESQQARDDSYQPREGDDRSQHSGDEDQQTEDQQQAQTDENQGDDEQDEKEQGKAANQSSEEEQEMNQAQMTESLPEPTDQDLTDQAEAQWLRRVPDDPGGLLRNKFRYQYGRQQNRQEEPKPW